MHTSCKDPHLEKEPNKQNINTISLRVQILKHTIVKEAILGEVLKFYYYSVKKYPPKSKLKSFRMVTYEQNESGVIFQCVRKK